MSNKSLKTIWLDQCTQCKTYFSLAPYACRKCGSEVLVKKPAIGIGIIRALTEVHRAPSEYWQQYAPYVLALIRLEEGPSIMGHLDKNLHVGESVIISDSVYDKEGVFFTKRNS